MAWAYTARIPHRDMEACENMGDKSPKSTKKNANQKASKASAADTKKKSDVSAKQVDKVKK